MAAVKKPKICIIHYSSPPVIGGVEFVIQAQARLFARAGYPVKLLTGKGGQIETKENAKVRAVPEIARAPERLSTRASAEKKIEVKVIPEIGTLEPVIPEDALFNKLTEKIYERLLAELKDVDFCIIHNCFTMPFNIALTASLHRLAKEVKRTRFICWFHDSPFLDPAYKEFLTTIDNDSCPWVLLRSSSKRVKYVAISEFRAAQLSRLFKLNPKKIKTIPDGIDLKGFLGLREQIEFLFGKFNLFEADMVGLTPVRISPRKNIELAIKIISELNRQAVSAKLLITAAPDPHKKGCLDYFRSLKDLTRRLKIEDKVIFVSDVKDQVTEKPVSVGMDLLRDLYRVCDFLLLPSFKEGFGIPLLEAGLLRMPVFCSRISPLRELGEDNVNYFGTGEPPEKVAGRIIQFFKRDKTLRMFKKTIRGYTWEAVFKKKIEPFILGKY